MKTYPDNAQIQLFGMFCFASTRVPYEVGTGVLTDDSLAAYDYALEIIMASNKKYNYTFKTFALNVLYNILSVHAGRAEFFSIRHITLQGEGRQDAIERHQLSQLKILLRYIERIPMETTHTSTKGSKTMQTVDIPTHEGIDIVEATLLVRMLPNESSHTLRSICIMCTYIIVSSVCLRWLRSKTPEKS